MNKTFNFILPDEPYKTTTALNQVVECTYTGPRYVLIQIDKDDHQCRAVAGHDDPDHISLDHSGYEQDEFDYRVIDANTHTLECAYMNEEYSHGVVTDYSEDITDADGNTTTFEHVYEDNTGILAHCYWQGSLLYQTASESFSGPDYREHVNSRESVVEGCAVQAQIVQDALDDTERTYSDEERAELEEYRDWLNNVDTTYAGINHWKWPFRDISELPEFL
jgi:hypothetical protein